MTNVREGVINSNANVSRRRPAVTATGNVAKKYEDLCSKKMELVDLQLSILRRFEKYQEETLSSIQEEHKKRVERSENLFKLDVELKIAQIQQYKNNANFEKY